MTEQRLIDANVLMDVLDELNVASFYELNEHSRETYYDFREAIKNAPTIEERKQGKWIDKGVIPNYPEEGFNIYHLLICDQCGCMHRTTVWCVNGKYINADFCPNCGALMR